MACWEGLKIFCKQLSGRQRDVLLSRSLGSLALVGHGGAHETGDHGIGEVERKGFRLPGLGGASTVSSSAHCAQISSQLEASVAASDPTPGFQALGSTVPGFSVSSVFKPVAPVPPRTLARRKAGCHWVRDTNIQCALPPEDGGGRDWVRLIDAAGHPNKSTLLVYNLLLHAKLRLGAHPDVLQRIVNEMETGGIPPNQLPFNFLLRSVFRQRNLKLSLKAVFGEFLGLFRYYPFLLETIW